MSYEFFSLHTRERLYMVHTDLFSTSLSRGRLPLLAAPLIASIISDHTTQSGNWVGWVMRGMGHQCGGERWGRRGIFWGEWENMTDVRRERGRTKEGVRGQNKERTKTFYQE